MAGPEHRTHTVTVVVLLYVRSGEEAEFRAYERKANAILAEYGGSIENVVTPYATAGDIATPDEVQILNFPDQSALAAYQSDPRMLALRSRRDRAIASTIMILGRPVSPADG
jgi:antibiotic biosynthesis monooxygenase (ABM) superfamily enzyme